jgi:hypothetical protein
MAQMSRPQLLDAAKSIAKIMGLSPEGTELWAQQSVERANYDAYSRVTQVEVQIGRELARSSPDRLRLNMLVNQYAARSAALDRQRKRDEINGALRLPVPDRQKVGLFIVQSARQSLGTAKPVLKTLP